MEIVLAKKEELEQVYQMELELYPAPWKLNDYLDLFSSPIFNLFLLKENGELLGYALLLTTVDMADIGKVSIAKKHQGKGYSHLLMNEMEKVAKTRNYKAIFLEVRESNNVAHSLYLKHGFKDIVVRKRYYGNEDGITMMKELS